MILPFIISTAVFFLFLIVLSVRSVLLSRRPAARLLFAAEGGISEKYGEERERAAAITRDGRADFEQSSGGADGRSFRSVDEQPSGGADGQSFGGVDEQPSGGAANEDEYKENIYKGILWMKEKYEQYRDLADERYERLKEELSKMEKKYEDLVGSMGSSPSGSSVPAAPVSKEPEEPKAAFDEAGGDEPWDPYPGQAEPGLGMVIVESAADHEIRARIQDMEEQFARERQRLEEENARLRHQLEEEGARWRRQLDEQSADAYRELELHTQHSNRLLEEKQRVIAEQEGQLRLDRQKIEELVAKLRHNGQLLLNIYQELDKSLHVTENPPGAKE